MTVGIITDTKKRYCKKLFAEPLFCTPYDETLEKDFARINNRIIR